MSQTIYYASRGSDYTLRRIVKNMNNEFNKDFKGAVYLLLDGGAWETDIPKEEKKKAKYLGKIDLEKNLTKIIKSAKRKEFVIYDSIEEMNLFMSKISEIDNDLEFEELKKNFIVERTISGDDY